MAEALTWDFVSTGGGDEDGPNNPKIEHFGGNYNYYLPREVIQNSLDARDDSSKPVRVDFRLEYVKREDFPNQTQFNEILSLQMEYNKENPDAVKVLKPAIDSLNTPTIPFLKISDYNTTGLNGSDSDRSGGWYSLVRSTGNSVKAAGAGGSFGIGKGAPFAASLLRTVFYATKNQAAVSVFQGKAELVSFKDEKDDIKRGVGSFGLKQASVRDGKLMPLDFWRKTRGTDIIIAGYKITTTWQKDLTDSVLRNFWYAILMKDLIVSIQGVEINHTNLDDQMVNAFVKESFKDHVKPLGNPLQYYLAIKEGNEMSENVRLSVLGKCKFFFKHIEKPMNYVAMLRKSHMVIYSRQFYFPSPYAGVFICDDEDGNNELRKMEPPAHDEWDPNRNLENGAKAYDEITSFIRSRLDKLKENENYEPLDVPELYKYLPYDEDNDNNSYRGNNENESNKEALEETFNLIQKQETFNKSIEILPTQISVLNPSGTRSLIGVKRKKNDKKRLKPEVSDLISKVFLLNQTGTKLTYRLFLKSGKDNKYNITFRAIGEDIEAPLAIIDAIDDLQSKILFSKNKIRLLQLYANQERFINIVIDFPVKLSLKIVSNVVQ